MSRLTAGNLIRAALAFFFCLFVAFYVLVIGMGARNKKVILEGGLYAAAFIAAVSVSGASGAFAGFAVRRVRKSQRGDTIQVSAPMPPPAQPSPGATTLHGPSDDLSSALAWVGSQAKQNKHRLPADTYVTILETCQMLDSVIDAEIRRPSADARFEYELEAMVREYLPTVLRGFLAIPPSLTDNRQPNGRTPNEELVEQLGLLLGQAETLHSTRHSQTSADLSSSGNFLRERFGHHQPGGFDFGIK